MCVFLLILDNQAYLQIVLNYYRYSYLVNSVDVGNVEAAGSAVKSATGQVTVKGSGWGEFMCCLNASYII